MLARIALGNIRKSARDYSVYFVTLVLGVSVFYAFNTIGVQTQFFQDDLRQAVRNFSFLVSGLTVALALVMGFLMVYANNFLMRRRTKELGLYQVLGMRRSQVSRIILVETLVVAMLSLAVGVALGLLLSQLLLFLTAAMFRSSVTQFKFFFSGEALAITLASFVLTFVLMALLNLRTLRKAKLVELMGSGRRSEEMRVRSLPLSAALFALGCALVGVAYWRLVHQGFPAFSANTTTLDFSLTTALVVIGTFTLFYGLSGLFVLLAQRSGSFYWRGLNMFSVRQLSSQINTNCVSMAAVSMVLFLAITSVTGGMGIRSMLNHNSEMSTVFDASVVGYRAPGNRNAPTAPLDIAEVLRERGVDVSEAGRHSQLTFFVPQNLVDNVDDVLLSTIASRVGMRLPGGFENANGNTLGLFVMSLGDYNNVRKLLGMPAVELGADEYLVTCTMPSVQRLYEGMVDQGYTITMGGRVLRPAAKGLISDRGAAFYTSPLSMNPGTLVVSDELVSGGTAYQSILNVMYDKPVEKADALMERAGDALDEYSQTEEGNELLPIAMSQTATEARAGGNGLSGIISYLAIYIGFVLVVSCATILAIQQLSGVSDSVARYRTLSELGCADDALYRSLRAQMAVSFVMPLLVGLAHSICALSVIIQLVETLGLVDRATSWALIAGVFLVVYGGYLLVSYHTACSVLRKSLSEARHAL